MAKTKLGKEIQSLINSIEMIIVDGKKAITALNEMTRQAEKKKPEDEEEKK